MVSFSLQCGRPVEVKVCPERKVNIGGTGYNLSQGNRVAQRYVLFHTQTGSNVFTRRHFSDILTFSPFFFRADRTMTGHVLGHPTARPKSLVSERNLSSVVVGITRILMHCAMIEGACRQPQVC